MAPTELTHRQCSIGDRLVELEAGIGVEAQWVVHNPCAHFGDLSGQQDYRRLADPESTHVLLEPVTGGTGSIQPRKQISPNGVDVGDAVAQRLIDISEPGQ